MRPSEEPVHPGLLVEKEPRKDFSTWVTDIMELAGLTAAAFGVAWLAASCFPRPESIGVFWSVLGILLVAVSVLVEWRKRVSGVSASASADQDDADS